MQEEKKQRGGFRPGSGRKKGKTKIQACFRIEEDLLDKMSEIGNKNKFVNTAIREKLERMKSLIKEVNELE